MNITYFCEDSPEHDSFILYGQSNSETPPEPTILARYIGGGYLVTSWLALIEIGSGSYWVPLGKNVRVESAKIVN